MTTKSTREAAMLAIQELAREDDKIVIVSPDAVAAARATKFREEFPDRVIEVGIAEQDAVDIAAGLATTGMKPVVVSYAGFLTMRACEMIRTFVAYPGLNVKFIGLNGGMLGGEREGVGVGAGALLHETTVPAKGLGAQPTAEETFAERDEQGGVRLREVVAPQAVRGAPIKGGMLAEGRRRPPAAHGGAEDAMEGDGELGIRVAHDGGLGKRRDVQTQFLAHLAHGGLGGGLAGLDLAAGELPFVGGGGITRGAAPDAEHGSGVIQDHGRGHAKMGFFHGVSLRGDGGARGWRR